MTPLEQDQIELLNVCGEIESFISTLATHKNISSVYALAMSIRQHLIAFREGYQSAKFNYNMQKFEMDE